MNKYECTACKREVVAPRREDTVEMVCCKGETPVKHTKVGTKLVIPVAKLPEAMTDKKPLPLSTPAPAVKK